MTELILAVITSGALSGFLTRIITIRGERKKTEIENDERLLKSYQLTIDDLNNRISDALARMRELETALKESNKSNLEKDLEISRLKAELERLKNNSNEN